MRVEAGESFSATELKLLSQEVEDGLHSQETLGCYFTHEGN